MTTESSEPLPRMFVAVLSLISGFVALYLHLWKIGKAGSLSCGGSGGGGCAIAQMSSWGWFMGVDVALIGVLGYAAILAVAVAGVQPRWRQAQWPTIALAMLVVPALLFTARLKYGEFIVLRTFCPWCAVSTVTIVICALLVLWDWRRVGRGRATRA